MKLNKLPLRNSEYVQYIRDLFKLIEPKENVKVTLAPKMTPLENQLNLMEQSSKTKNTVLSKQLRQKDEKRDITYIGLISSIETQARHWEDSIKTAADLALTVVKRHIKSIRTLNYQAETDKIKTVISELRDLETSQGLLTTLGNKEWVDKLEEFNNEFSELFATRTISDAENTWISVTRLRQESYSMLNALMSLLASAIELKESQNEDFSEYQSLSNEIDVLNSKYNDLNNLRS